MTPPPLTILKWPLLLLATTLALAAAGALWSRGLAQEATLALQQQQKTLAGAQQTLSHSRQQLQRIQHHLADYQALTARGFLAAEDRLAWIEAAQHANRDVQLYGLNYRLAPRTAAPAALAQGLPLATTHMTLTLPLLVETDLGRFLRALKARAPGVMRVQHCHLSQPSEGAFVVVTTPRLEAECELHWYTLITDHKAQP